MKTNLQSLQSADWTHLERDVTSKIHLLHEMVLHLPPHPIHDKIANDLILPALAHLSAFCQSVDIIEEDNPTPTDAT